MATLTDSTADALDALVAACREAMPAPPSSGVDDGVGVEVLLGPDQDRTAVPRAVTLPAAFNAELDPLTVARVETGAGPQYADTITVVCSLLARASTQRPERDFASWRRQASAMLGDLGVALRSQQLAAVVARARLLSERWYDAYDNTGVLPVAVVIDAQVELTVLS